jgi:hypothetical protein
VIEDRMGDVFKGEVRNIKRQGASHANDLGLCGGFDFRRVVESEIVSSYSAGVLYKEAKSAVSREQDDLNRIHWQTFDNRFMAWTMPGFTIPPVFAMLGAFLGGFGVLFTGEELAAPYGLGIGFLSGIVMIPAAYLALRRMVGRWLREERTKIRGEHGIEPGDPRYALQRFYDWLDRPKDLSSYSKALSRLYSDLSARGYWV